MNSSCSSESLEGPSGSKLDHQVSLLSMKKLGFNSLLR